MRRLVLCAVLLGFTLAAQPAPGTLVGVLKDPNNNALTGFNGAVLFAKNLETGRDFSVDVQLTGEYTLSGLPPGTYDLVIPLASAMYLTAAQKNVKIVSGEQRINMQAPWGMNLGTLGDDPDMLGKDMRRKAKVSGPTPRLANGKPDFSGMWSTIIEARRPVPYPLKPWAMEIQKQIDETIKDKQNPGSYCLPQAASPFLIPFPHKLVQAQGVIIHMTEFTTPGYRQVFIDGRKHPEDWNPAWMGHSVGHYEGDTLVIDSVGFNELTAGFSVHSEKLHVVERWTRPDNANLVVEIAADDADAYTRVWKTTVRAALVPDEEILEFVCAENNKDPLHFGGLGWIDHARPPAKPAKAQ